jgi:thermitase
MRLTPRRVTVGLVSTAVVVTMTSVSTWALAADSGSTPAAAPVRLIVGYKAGADPAAAVKTMSAMGARTAASSAGQQALDALHATTLQVPASRSASLIASLRSDPSVAYVEVDQRRKIAEVTPTDPYYNVQPEAKEVNLPTAWDLTTGSAVKIAVIDTGVNGVGDLTGAVLPGYDFVNGDSDAADDFVYEDGDIHEYGHGTTVASLIAARANNGEGIAGACWSCEILPVKVLDSDGGGWDSTVASGISYAVSHGAQVINLSLGGPGSSKVLADAVAWATFKGVLVVAAAGNENSNAKSYPAAYNDVVAVGATAPCPNTEADPTCTTGTLERAWFSNYNTPTHKWVDVAAPGSVTGMDSNGHYARGMQGTSFSAPIVSGIAGLIKTAHPNYTGWSLMNSIQQGSVATPVAGGWVSYGKVNAVRSVPMGTDLVAPTATGVLPANNARVRGTVTVTALKAADAWSGLNWIQLYVDGVYKTYSWVAPFTTKWNSAGRNGPVKLRLRVIDKAGNVRVLDRTIIADNTAPAVKITKAPKNKSKIKGTVKIYYTGSDKYGMSRYQLIVNGKVIQTHTSTSSPFTVVAGKYPKNSIRVQVRAYDLAGNSRITSVLTYHR